MRASTSMAIACGLSMLLPGCGSREAGHPPEHEDAEVIIHTFIENGLDVGVLVRKGMGSSANYVYRPRAPPRTLIPPSHVHEVIGRYFDHEAARIPRYDEEDDIAL